MSNIKSNNNTDQYFAQVIVDVSASDIDRVFDYVCTDDSHVGYRVLVPFGAREIEGYVIGTKNTTEVPISKLKYITKYIDDRPLISQELLQLKDYMVCTCGLKVVDILRLFIPAQMRGGRIKELNRVAIQLNPKYTIEDIDNKTINTSRNQRDVFGYMCQVKTCMLSDLSKEYSVSAINNLVKRDIFLKIRQQVARTPYKDMASSNSTVQLTELQQQAVSNILQYNHECLNCTQDTSGDLLTRHNTVVLHGVTGSGKTEVYLNLIAHVLSQNKTAIMLVPEISLTPQTLRIFRGRFGDQVAILHSGLSAGERFDEWQRLLNGTASVAVGARSAIFAPVSNIGIIIIDEEHDSSYQSESNPRYNTKYVAQYRATYNNCCLVLGSATPSIETYYNTRLGNYKLVEMSSRVNFKPLPNVDIVDMKKEIFGGNDSPFSQALLRGLHQCMKTPSDKAMLFLNRRGYSSYVICRECGVVARCTDCDVSLVYHKEDNILKCHFCNLRFAMLTHCPACKSQHIRRGFVGTEQVVDRLKEYFPHIKVVRMDNDTTQNKDSHLKLLDEFGNGQARILVGTQMIAKGHDFGQVSFVGIIDADMSLHFADYRACERTYQLITQVSGRAGRANIEGNVVLQTYTPNHYTYKFAVKGDYEGFFDKECNLREVTKYPPFSTIIRVLISSEDEERAQSLLKAVFDQVVLLRNSIDTQAKLTHSAFIYLACMRSPVKRIQNKHRMQVLMRVIPSFAAQISLKIFEIVKGHTDKISIFVEINPSNLS
ncbi:MAG: primosomal protein N' [Clostridiales bacterium]|jgi:primosomal protein N' (replication factor Y)|nr:primosomal protein N' [Clostridiales bacterium]